MDVRPRELPPFTPDPNLKILIGAWESSDNIQYLLNMIDLPTVIHVYVIRYNQYCPSCRTEPIILLGPMPSLQGSQTLSKHC
jgi:hypothetical protein